MMGKDLKAGRNRKGDTGGVDGPKILLRSKSMCDEHNTEHMARLGG